jgi:hypothetical protein
MATQHRYSQEGHIHARCMTLYGARTMVAELIRDRRKKRDWRAADCARCGGFHVYFEPNKGKGRWYLG